MPADWLVRTHRSQLLQEYVVYLRTRLTLLHPPKQHERICIATIFQILASLTQQTFLQPSYWGYILLGILVFIEGPSATLVGAFIASTMWILLTGQTFYKRNNGQAAFTINLAEKIARNNHDILVICPSEYGHAYRKVLNGKVAIDRPSFHAR